MMERLSSCPNKLAKCLAVTLCLMYFSNPLSAQFDCLSLAYLFQGSETGVYAVDLASGQYSSQVDVLIPGNKLNAVGYDASTNHIWAFNMTTKQLVEYDGNFGDETLYTVSGVDKSFYVGDIHNRTYYLVSGSTMYKVDLSSGTPTFSGTSSFGVNNVHDIAFNPVDNQIYTVQANTNRIYRVSTTSGSATNLGTPADMSSNGGAYGAVFFDASGDFYASNNNNGRIYRIKNVHTLSSGGTPSAIMFAYGPSSGNNDGTKCPVSEISEEGCANALDDNEDDSVDCDDPLCVSNVACRVGGALVGGLETNGGLSEKIAFRDFYYSRHDIQPNNRATFPKLERKINSIDESSNFFRSDYSIEEFIPIDAIPGTETYETTPRDLVGLSNAVQVAGMDAYQGNNRVGAVLAVKSDQGVYEHSKYVCDRVKGTRVREIRSMKLDGEHDFSVTWFQNPDGGQEWGTLFSIFENEEGEFVLESHWSTYAYSDQPNYYNFQVWGNGLQKLELMVNEILDLLETKAPIAEYRTSKAPDVFVNDLSYENEVLTLTLQNKVQAKRLTFDGVQADNETGKREAVTFDISLSGNEFDTIAIPRKFYTLGGTLTYDADEPFDQIYVGNGSWGLNYDSDQNSVESYTVSASNHNSLLAEGSWIERNVKVKGTLGDEFTVFRTIKNAARPKDLSKFNTLAVELEGTGALEIVLVKDAIKIWEDQPRVTVQLEGQCQQTYLSKADFAQKDGQIEWDDLKSIAFIKKNSSGTSQQFELEIRNLAFVFLNEIPSCGQFNQQEVKAYPNPMRNELNLVLSAGGYQNFSLAILNQMGQVVGQGSGITNGQGEIKYIQSNLTPRNVLLSSGS